MNNVVTKKLLRLAKNLGYEFSDLTLLKTALTHRSAAAKNNERLEFLGDAVLGVVIAEALFTKLTKASEGELTRLRASLVKKDTLALIADEIQLEQFLIVGSGELKSGGLRRASTQADALEAIFGAVAQDGGFAAAKALILALYATRLADISLRDVKKDPKTALQEFQQSKGKAVPQYTVQQVTGNDNDQTFVVECILTNGNKTIGEGASRKRAEQQAASNMLSELHQQQPQRGK